MEAPLPRKIQEAIKARRTTATPWRTVCSQLILYWLCDYGHLPLYSPPLPFVSVFVIIIDQLGIYWMSGHALGNGGPHLVVWTCSFFCCGQKNQNNELKDAPSILRESCDNLLYRSNSEDHFFSLRPTVHNPIKFNLLRYMMRESSKSSHFRSCTRDHFLLERNAILCFSSNTNHFN